MAIQKLPIADFLALAQSNVMLDVRSPSEYKHAHMPHAISLSLFSDEERKIVGTAYKQQGKQIAIKIGLDYFGPKMKAMVEEVEGIIRKYELGITGSLSANLHKDGKLKDNSNPQPVTPKPATILLHCWRGGMRSAAIAWLLDLYGFKVYTLVGGYKAYRNWVLQQFEITYPFKIIGGYTGTGKTLLLEALAKDNHATIDLEGLANHKGSALGALGQLPQPSQEMFENLLAGKLFEKNNKNSNANEPTANYQLSSANCPLPTVNYIWLEDESQRIGNVQIPIPLWKNMRNSNVYFMDIPFEERLNYLTAEYGVHKKQDLVAAIMRIQKRLGGLETKNAINFLLEDNCKECFRILLIYYDKWYLKGLYNREHAVKLIKKVAGDKVDTATNTKLLIENIS